MASLTEYLDSIGQPSDFKSKQKLAASYGIANYVNSDVQDQRILQTIQSGGKPIDFQKNQQTIQRMGREPNPNDPNDVINFAKATYSQEEMPSVYQKMIDGISQKNALLAGAPSDVPAYDSQQIQQMLSSGQLTQEDLAKLYPSIQSTGKQAIALAGSATERKNLLPGALNTLQTALKMASDVGNQPTGESQIFQQLGLDSYETLMQSLRARQEEMGFKYESYANLVEKIGTSLYAGNQQRLDEAKLALDNYNSLRDDYKYETDRLDKIAAESLNYERQLEITQKEHELALERDRIKAEQEGKPSPEALLKAHEEGLDWIDGQGWISSDITSQINFKTPGKSKVATYSLIYPGSSLNAEGPDFAGERGSPITASMAGRVVDVYKFSAIGDKNANGGWGNQVVVQDQFGNYHKYSHLASVKVDVGDDITEGSLIATMGNTGHVLKGDTATEPTLDEAYSGRGTHLDYTVYKPDGVTKYPFEDQLRFAFGIKESEKKKIFTEDQQSAFKTITTQIRQDLDHQMGTFIKNAYLRGVSGYRQQDGFGDISLITAFQKTNDAMTGVREQEFKTAADAAGYVQQVANVKGKVLEGDKLSPVARNALMKALDDLYLTGISQINDSQRKKYSIFAEKTGLSYEEDIKDFVEFPQDLSVLKKEATVTTISTLDQEDQVILEDIQFKE